MSEEIRIWQIGEGDSLRELSRSKLDVEKRIEQWLCRDVSLLRPDLLVIGEQVVTAFGGYIDVLCLDRDGNCVVVELKRDKTPREITAQVLDYASWVKELSADDIYRIAQEYLKQPLEDAFRKRFQIDLPDSVNERHSMLVVGSEIDGSSERIIRYLSDTYGVEINAATFGYFRTAEGQEFLARTFLVEPDEVQRRTSEKTKRVSLSYEQLQAEADKRGVGELYRTLKDALAVWFSLSKRKASVAFAGETDGSIKAIFSLLPDQSSSEDGLRFQVYTERLMNYARTTAQYIESLLPSNREQYQYYPGAPSDLQGWTGFFISREEVERFVNGLAQTDAFRQQAGSAIRAAASGRLSETKKTKAVASNS